jgi:curved DNA-binding protein CbpA
MNDHQNHYELLGIREDATGADIKKAFRDKAKQLHPDIAGAGAEDAMRALIAAYETLLDERRRHTYDRMLTRFVKTCTFDYRQFLREEPDDPKMQARLIFFELMHNRGDDAITVWRAQGALSYPMRAYMEREDWMDCAFLLAEELGRRAFYPEACALLREVLEAENDRPYFKHFALDVRAFLKSLTKKMT